MNVKLIMFKSSGKRKEFTISNPKTVIGRGEECDLRVPLLSVSRRQCELRIDGSQLKIKDMGSSNGTYINNKRIAEAVLKAGDRLTIGPVILTVQIDGQPQEIKPVQPSAKKNAADESGEIIALNPEDMVEGDPDAETIDLTDLAGGATVDDSDPLTILETLDDDEEDKLKPQPKKK